MTTPAADRRAAPSDMIDGEPIHPRFRSSSPAEQRRIERARRAPVRRGQERMAAAQAPMREEG